MAVMQTTMIRASMTAYSTAVGPLSSLRKFTTAFFRLFMFVSLLCQCCPTQRSRALRGSRILRARRCPPSGRVQAAYYLAAAGLADLRADVAERVVGVAAQ